MGTPIPPGRILYLMGDGPLRGELERYISSRHLESIRLTGFIPHEEQGAVRAACGLSVAPSLWEETFGMVVLESWLHGTPVIVTPNGGLPELITHGRNGWIAQEPSVESLAETLHTALKQEERWPSMGAHGQQLLSSTYSPAAWLRSMEALLGELRVSIHLPPHQHHEMVHMHSGVLQGRPYFLFPRFRRFLQGLSENRGGKQGHHAHTCPGRR